MAAPTDTLNCAELHESGAFGGQQALSDADAAAEPEVDALCTMAKETGKRRGGLVVKMELVLCLAGVLFSS